MDTEVNLIASRHEVVVQVDIVRDLSYQVPIQDAITRLLSAPGTTVKFIDGVAVEDNGNHR